MKLIHLFIILLTITGCSKFKIESKGTKLASIEYTQNDKSWMEIYTYDSSGLLSQVEDQSISGRKYVIERENDIIKEFKTYNFDDKLIFRDSIIYNQNGSISKIFNFSINSGEDLPLSLIHQFEYDEKGVLKKRTSLRAQKNEIARIYKYTWKNGNIINVEEFDDQEVLQTEYFYKYDKKENYNIGKPFFLTDPIYWSENNIKKMDFTDHSGLIDSACNPCKSRYKYNRSDFPVKVKFDWDRELVLKYE